MASHVFLLLKGRTCKATNLLSLMTPNKYEPCFQTDMIDALTALSHSDIPLLYKYVFYHLSLSVWLKCNSAAKWKVKVKKIRSLYTWKDTIPFEWVGLCNLGRKTDSHKNSYVQVQYPRSYITHYFKWLWNKSCDSVIARDITVEPRWITGLNYGAVWCKDVVRHFGYLTKCRCFCLKFTKFL